MQTEVLFNREANEWIHRIIKSRLPKHVERRGAPWMVRNIEQERIINKILSNVTDSYGLDFSSILICRAQFGSSIVQCKRSL